MADWPDHFASSNGLQAGAQLPDDRYAIAMAHLHSVETCLDHEKFHASSYTEAYACQLHIPGPG
jgi:hypothetical protein